MSIQTNVYGPPKHTLAFGCSISDLSTTLGWNDQITSMTMTLVQDPCSSIESKFYYDQNTLQELTTTSPDPGFTKPTPGTFQYIRFGDYFEFFGIVQSWVQLDSEGGHPTYSITVTDPRELLEGVQLILSSYEGSIGNTPNLFNIFGFSETFGNSCPACFGGAFGGSNESTRGLEWNVIKNCISIMTSALFPIINSYGLGRVYFMADQYLVDLSELPYIPNYRVQGTNIALSDVIKQICSDSGLDYYIECQGLVSDFGLLKVIKVRTASRRFQPVLGQIAAFVGNGVGSISSNQGLELRNEVVQSVYVGGQKERIYEQFLNGQGSSATIWPYWGVNTNGNAIIGTDVGDKHQFTIDLSYLQITGLSSYTITVKELRCALGGQDAWLSYIAYSNPTVATLLGVTTDNAPLSFKTLINNVKANQANPNPTKPEDLLNFRNGAIQLAAGWMSGAIDIKLVDLVWGVISTYASDFYGKKFMVSLPDLCVKFDPESQIVQFSEEPSDAGWVDLNSTVLGINNPADLDLFRNDDSRVPCFVAFGNPPVYQLDLTDLNPDDAFVEGNTLFLRAEVEKDYVFTDKTDLTSLRAVIDLASVIRLRKVTQEQIPYFFFFIIDQAKLQGKTAGIPEAVMEKAVQDVLKQLGTGLIQFSMEYPANIPSAAAIPLKSNIDLYGPWSVSSFAVGKIEYNQETDLVPWNFGSVAGLDAVGIALANDQVTGQQVGETGLVEVPGSPVLKLGDELQFGAGSLSALRETVLSCVTVNDDGTAGSHPVGQGNTPVGPTQFETVNFSTNAWSGIYGPNVTGIDIRVGVQGVVTTYRMKTFTPSFGVFARQNAERLRRVGQTANQLLRRQRAGLRTPQPLALGLRQRGQRLIGSNGPIGTVNKTPHNGLLGQLRRNNDGTSTTTIQSQNMMEAKTELQSIENKHFLSLDGMFRPYRLGFASLNPSGASTMDISSNGSWNANPTTSGHGRYSLPAFPPTNSSSIFDVNSDKYEFMPINAYTLNPLLGIGTIPIYPFANNSGGTDIGHVTTDSGMFNQADQNLPTTNSWNSIALKGPLILNGWGYDINGKPVPNAGSGLNLQDKFASGWLQKPHTWPVGPVDLRWDADRGVWSCFPGFRIVPINWCSSGVLPQNFGNATIQDGVGGNFDYTEGLKRYAPVSRDGSGIGTNCGSNAVSGLIKVFNRFNYAIPSGKGGMAYYDTNYQNYFLIESDFVPTGLVRATLVSQLNAGGSATMNLDTNQYDVPVTGLYVAVSDWAMKAGTSVPSGAKIFAEPIFNNTNGITTFYMTQTAGC